MPQQNVVGPTQAKPLLVAGVTGINVSLHARLRPTSQLKAAFFRLSVGRVGAKCTGRVKEPVQATVTDSSETAQMLLYPLFLLMGGRGALLGN